MPSIELVDPYIILSGAFNEISDIHHQSEYSSEELKGLRDIFVNHGVANKYGLQLLHRHYSLPPDTVAFCTPIDDEISATKVTPLDDVNVDELRGQYYLLNEDGRFQAYEYEHGPAEVFPDEFLKDIAGFIVEHNLRHKVAISSTVLQNPIPSLEWEFGSQATVTASGASALLNTEATSRAVKVHWSFDPASEGPQFEGGCEETTAGTHRVLYLVGTCAALKSNIPFDFDRIDVKKLLRESGMISADA
jgi:hypothetical protein